MGSELTVAQLVQLAVEYLARVFRGEVDGQVHVVQAAVTLVAMDLDH